jgi:hypothetical protein
VSRSSAATSRNQGDEHEPRPRVLASRRVRAGVGADRAPADASPHPFRYEVWSEKVLVKPVAHVSYKDKKDRAVTALIVGNQVALAIVDGKLLAPEFGDHDVSDPGVTL